MDCFYNIIYYFSLSAINFEISMTDTSSSSSVIKYYGSSFSIYPIEFYRTSHNIVDMREVLQSSPLSCFYDVVAFLN